MKTAELQMFKWKQNMKIIKIKNFSVEFFNWGFSASHLINWYHIFVYNPWSIYIESDRIVFQDAFAVTVESAIALKSCDFGLLHFWH